MSDGLMGMLGPIGAGISLFGGISGLIGSANAEHQAEVAAQNAIRDFKASGDEERLAILGGGTAGLENLSGGLNNALVSGGKSLGAALAGAGINNSSAAAGAVANQAGQNAAVEGRYSSGLAYELVQQTAQTDQQAAQMGYGLAVNNLNYARQQQQGAESGLGQFFGSLGQMNFGSLFGTNQGGGVPSNNAANLNGVLPPTNGPVQNVQNQWGNGTGPGQMNNVPRYAALGGGLGGGGALNF